VIVHDAALIKYGTNYDKLWKKVMIGRDTPAEDYTIKSMNVFLHADSALSTSRSTQLKSKTSYVHRKSNLAGYVSFRHPLCPIYCPFIILQGPPLIFGSRSERITRKSHTLGINVIKRYLAILIESRNYEG
jgi:hypothetical protein